MPIRAARLQARTRRLGTTRWRSAGKDGRRGRSSGRRALMRSRSSGGAACRCESPALAYGVGRKSQRRGVKSLGAHPRQEFQVGAHGSAGQAASLPEWSPGISNQWGCRRAVDDGRAGHMKIPSLGQSDGRQVMGSGRYSCFGDTECQVESPGCTGKSARVESRVSSKCGR